VPSTRSPDGAAGQLDGLVDGQLVRREVLRAARPSAGPPLRRAHLDVRAVAADAHDDRPAVLGQPDRDGADRPGVDLVQVLADDRLEAALAGQPALLAVGEPK
jgi:hypothetical protein